MKRSALIGFVLLSTITSCTAISYAQRETKTITLSQFGLNEAATGEQVYWALYNAHTAAVAQGKMVDYSGIDTLNLEIPDNAQSIPLSYKNDFCGAVLSVTNLKKDIALFELVNESHPLTIRKKDIDNCVFNDYPQLQKGRYLLYIEDMNPWVENREGYKYGHRRKDILLVINGKAVNKVVMPYDNPYSKPACRYYKLNDLELTLNNITLNRTEKCSFKTFLCMIEGIDNFNLNNVTIHTPENNGENDNVIRIHHSTNVSFNNLVIDGTYSRKDYSGYGVNLDNIWNFNVDNMYGHGNFGIFGTNNINQTTISNSDINRFDIHCYGKDVSFKNVIFRDKYNQFASVYGTIRFENCSFIDFVPIINSHTYNAYVGYDLFFKDCEYSTKRDTPILVDESYLDDNENARPELSKRCLPNVTIDNMTINLPKVAPNVYLFFLRERGTGMRPVDYISKISINGLKFIYKESKGRKPANFVLSNLKIKSVNEVKQNYKNIDINNNAQMKTSNRGKIIDNIKKDSRRNVQTNFDVGIILPALLILGGTVYVMKSRLES